MTIMFPLSPPHPLAPSECWRRRVGEWGRGRNASRRSGFTLLELLVVVAIVGILAAIAVPALKHSPQRAREATLKEDLFSMRSVIDQYHGDKGNYPADL